MKQIYLSFIIVFFFSTNIFSQYSETFSTPNRGLLSGTNTTTSPGSSTMACPANTLAACANSDFTGTNWTITGNFTGFDSDDILATNGSGVLFFGGDIDNELCFESPSLDISTPGIVTFSVDVIWTDHDGPDYVDVEYMVDNGAWIQVANQFGGQSHTVDFSTSSTTGSGTVTETGITGSTLKVRVCADSNTGSDGEAHAIDNVSVPEAGVTVIGDNPTVSISSITSSVSENSGDNLVYRFSRTGDTSGTLPVNFSISGTASDTDFSVSTGGAVTYNSGVGTGTITFPSNDATVDLMVSATGDLTIEADETVVVTILP